MLIPVIIVAIAYGLGIAALLAWARRHAKAREAYQRRAAIIAHIRDGVDKDGPIVGWMVRDDSPTKPGPRVGDYQ
jgi:hypothetical protein